MADLSRNHHDGVKAKSKQGDGGRRRNARSGRLMEIGMDDIGTHTPFEHAGYRHLRKDTIARIVDGGFQKVVIVHEGQRKVILLNGKSTRPFYETAKGQRLGWAEEKI